jgi:mono/diheme cytochrome c family protein
MRSLSILTVVSAVLLLGSPNVFAHEVAALYQATCSNCHGQNGAADTPIAGAMSIKPFQAVTTEQVEAAMGRPAHQALKLSPEDLAAVAKVVAGFGSQ